MILFLVVHFSPCKWPDACTCNRRWQSEISRVLAREITGLLPRDERLVIQLLSSDAMTLPRKVCEHARQMGNARTTLNSLQLAVHVAPLHTHVSLIKTHRTVRCGTVPASLPGELTQRCAGCEVRRSLRRNTLHVWEVDRRATTILRTL